MTVRFWDLFSHWIILSWLIGLEVFPLLVLGAVFTTIGQFRIIWNAKGDVNLVFVFFRLMSHYVPLLLSSKVVNIPVCVGLLVAYIGTLTLRGKTPRGVYKEVLSEPADMTLKEYFQRRSGIKYV